MTVGEQIRSALKEAGLTQEEAAHRLGKALQTVSNWIRGLTEPKHGDIRAIAKVTGKPVAYFFAEEDDTTGSVASRRAAS